MTTETSRVSDAEFMANVRLCQQMRPGPIIVICSECGMGMEDEELDDHDPKCSRFDPWWKREQAE
jgi:hypothetical protein